MINSKIFVIFLGLIIICCDLYAADYQPLFNVDDGFSLEDDYTKHPDYIFARYFFKKIEEHTKQWTKEEKPLKESLDKIIVHLRAIEADKYSLDSKWSIDWLLQIHDQAILDVDEGQNLQHIKNHITNIIRKKRLPLETMKYVLIYWLDTHDKNFYKLTQSQKFSYPYESLVWRLMAILDQPPSTLEKLSQTMFQSRYVTPVVSYIEANGIIGVFGSMGGFIAAAIITKTSPSWLWPVLMAVGGIGAPAYNIFHQWRDLKKLKTVDIALPNDSHEFEETF